MSDTTNRAKTAITFTPALLAAHAHDTGHLVREALREVAKLRTTNAGNDQLARMQRLLTLAQDHCDSTVQAAGILSDHGVIAPLATLAKLNLAEIVNSELSIWQPHASASGNKLQVTSAVPASIVGNEALVCRAVRNLLLNGISAALPETTISISIAQGDPQLASITISNMGRAPDAEIIQRLETNSSAAPVCSGLGLFIAARIAQLHGGTLRAMHNDLITSFTLTLNNDSTSEKNS